MATALSTFIRNVAVRHVRIFDDQGRLANVDELTGGLQTRDSLSNLVNLGRVFLVSDIVLGLGNGTSNFILIRPDPQYAPHLTIELSADSTVTARFYESPTTSADGTELTPRNKNRIIGNGVRTAFFNAPTVSDNGTIIVEQIIPANVRALLGMSPLGEFILDPSKEYLVEISNESGGSADTDTTMAFFEEKRPI